MAPPRISRDTQDDTRESLKRESQKSTAPPISNSFRDFFGLLSPSNSFAPSPGKQFVVERMEERRSTIRARPRTIFADADEMKERLRNQIFKQEYNVADFYHKTGWCQCVARSNVFENTTLAVVLLNAAWIAVDTELNDAAVLLEAKPEFQVVEQAFCFYFTMELLVRFASFRDKRNCGRDAWFVFDSILVFLMVMETWVMTLILLCSGVGGSGGGGSIMNASVLRIGRLMRLSRMARMARLLRAMPELLILIKGMLAAVRSVCFTLLLLLILTYAFGIAFKQLAVGTEAADLYFKTLPMSMHTLLRNGTLLDGLTIITTILSRDAWYLLVLFYFYVLLSSLTVMNMLIGVLCQVVSNVSQTEREQMTITAVKDKLKHIMDNTGIDRNGDNLISEDEFHSLLENAEAAKCLQEVGVDVVGLVDVAEFVFEDADAEDGDDGGRQLSFPKFCDVILNLRGSNTATVKDIVDLRKSVRSSLQELDEAIHLGFDNITANESVASASSLKTGEAHLARLKAPPPSASASESTTSNLLAHAERAKAALAEAQQGFGDFAQASVADALTSLGVASTSTAMSNVSTNSAAVAVTAVRLPSCDPGSGLGGSNSDRAKRVGHLALPRARSAAKKAAPPSVAEAPPAGSEFSDAIVKPETEAAIPGIISSRAGCLVAN